MSDDRIHYRLGTVICTNDSPSVGSFSFVVEGESDEVLVRRSEFIGVNHEMGIVIARVQDLVGTNRYYQHAEAVREYQSRGEPLRTIFPTDRWQYTIAQAQVLGLWTKTGIKRPSFAVSPGAVVRTVDDEVLSKFLKLDMKTGLHIGKLAHHGLEFKPDMDRLLSKHLAVLAMSGAGKSYFVSVLLEELVARKKELGRLAVIVIDVHGEYSYLEKIHPSHLNLEEDAIEVERIRGTHFQIPVHTLGADAIGALVAGMSSVQKRDLRRILGDIRKVKKDGYTLLDLIEFIRLDEAISKNTREALIGWILDLEETGLFGRNGVPDIEESIQPGKMILVDLSDFVSLKKKQIVVTNLAHELLTLRRREKIPPFLLVVEEAHQFCPESRHELALPKSRLETIAREGRKFHALLCLISQRPVKLSTTILSQCSNQAILRATNPYDLDHIGKSSEGIDRAALNSITTLEVGEALFVGDCVSVPTFVKVRSRHYEPEGVSISLSDAARMAERQ